MRERGGAGQLEQLEPLAHAEQELAEPRASKVDRYEGSATVGAQSVRSGGGVRVRVRAIWVR